MAVAALVLAGCGGQQAAVPPLPPAPHAGAGGPALAAITRAGRLRVAADLSYPPMAFRDGGVPAGFDVELAGLLARALGVRAEVIDTPAAVTREGFPSDIDLVMNAAPSGPAPVSVPYYTAREAVLVPAGGSRVGRASLRGRRVAAAAGGAGASTARTAGAVLVPTYLPLAAMDLAASGRVDAAIVEEPLAAAFAKAHPRLSVVPLPGTEAPFVIGIRPDAPDLGAFVSAAIRELDGSGGLAQLRKRWHLE